MSRILQSEGKAIGSSISSANITNITNNVNAAALDANIITVFEHQRLTARDFAHATDFHWLMAQEYAVFSIKRQQGQWQLKVGHYIGVILLPSGMALEILPKLMAKMSSKHNPQQPYESSKSSAINQTRQWVQDMLVDLTNSSQSKSKLPNTKNLGQLSTQLAALPTKVPPLSDWLIAQFVQRLAHYQPTKHYQAQVHNQAALQGRLLIKEQLRHNSMQPHKFVCESSVLSQDMLSNRLIKSALVLLVPLSPTSMSLPSLQQWQQVAVLSRYELQRLKPLYQQAKHQLALQPLSQQQSQAAQQLLDLAYWLLQQSPTHTGNGINSHALANQNVSQPLLCLLIDMNQAFEQWASLRIATMFQQANSAYKPLFQTQSVWLNDAEGQACLSIRPDLLIYKAAAAADNDTQLIPSQTQNQGNIEISERSGHYSHVIDMKWKHLAHACAISANDAYQLTSYAQAYRAEQVWLVYPVQDNSRQPVELRQQACNKGDSTDCRKTANKPLNAARLWLIPFNVITGDINGGLLPDLNVV
ncbi:5-methylcytosine-specific restriction enzyme subunit McrC [Psychrobacter luti]|uniref:5-methylcytosine-specific restriction enzyme subunit McrC n=1 Tax=Psychrobacter luti TaxID=198481 RepID=A0A839TC50_9GAMM|nr:hypothetical protein [Psychrobacter luti]MBB3106719.1 5-methylcytosine-specific restriction enzyme subunit McrC [Psychrobacter luti]